ncbi:SDR family NAD(P)-dependent oxidoreductase [Microbacterium sp. A196]
MALVTGAASGIGRACAEALGHAGAQVVLAGLGPIDETVRQLRRDGITAVGVNCDVTDSEQLTALVAMIDQEFGRLDTVLANAGAALDEPAAPDELGRLDTMYALHVRSVTMLAGLVLPRVASSGGGSFLVMSSIAGLRGNRVLSGYGVTKAANAQIARNIAVQWGPRGIRANAISPGVIDTEFARPITADPVATEIRLAKTPLRRFGTPQEVAGTVVWLASPAGGFVSGQNIVVDGGTLVAD